MQQAFDSSNPLITLSESHRKLSLRALEFILASWAISMAIGQALADFAELWMAIAAGLLGLAISRALYNSASRKYCNSETKSMKTAHLAYASAKSRSYKIISAVIYANCLILICCCNQWVAFAAFIIWMVLFLQLPKAAEIQRDFAYGDDDDAAFF